MNKDVYPENSVQDIIKNAYVLIKVNYVLYKNVENKIKTTVFGEIVNYIFQYR